MLSSLLQHNRICIVSFVLFFEMPSSLSRNIDDVVIFSSRPRATSFDGSLRLVDFWQHLYHLYILLNYECTILRFGFIVVDNLYPRQLNACDLAGSSCESA
jgi:hypothetical protein